MSNIIHRSQNLLIPDANVVKMFPMWGKGEPLYLWAERGLVHFEDARTDGGYGKMSIEDAGKRVLGISQMIINSSEDRRWGKERQETQRFICAMEKVIRQALEQGSPDDPDAAKELKRRRGKSMVVPRAIDRVVSGDPVYNL